MPSIFISYRRSDSHADAGRIYDRLIAHFGKEAVFKDVDDIPPGVDFRDYLNQTLKHCQVLLAVIGPNWLNAMDDKGRRRLDNPGDWVRVEIEEALHQPDVLVVPVLVSNATMPGVDELPVELKDLAYRNCGKARPDPDFNKDIDRLIRGIDQHLNQSPSLPKVSFSSRSKLSRQQFLKWSGLGGVGLLAALGTGQLIKEFAPAGTPIPSELLQLEAFLKAQQWQEADQETLEVMLRLANREADGWLNEDSLRNFPCEILQGIDQLWVAASGGKFGFSVQHRIYTSTCAEVALGDEITQESYLCLADQVGWTRVWDTPLDDAQVTYSLDAPAGHLPWKVLCGPDYCDASRNELTRYGALQSRLAGCQTRR
jgi:hypothetical protein